MDDHTARVAELSALYSDAKNTAAAEAEAWGNEPDQTRGEVPESFAAKTFPLTLTSWEVGVLIRAHGGEMAAGRTL